MEVDPKPAVGRNPTLRDDPDHAGVERRGASTLPTEFNFLLRLVWWINVHESQSGDRSTQIRLGVRGRQRTTLILEECSDVCKAFDGAGHVCYCVPVA